MLITGIICEYNPLHLGHQKQLKAVRAENPESGIVCLMSGNFVQRGAPAVFHKSLRAEAAIRAGADLVLELPVTAAVASAEGFAAGGVRILSRFCNRLSFGAETADHAVLMSTAEALLCPMFPEYLRTYLDQGLSFPAARQAALGEMGADASFLSQPNNILAVEYCKAILSQNSKLIPAPILRQGSYHDTNTDAENPSATSLRSLMEEGGSWLSYVPEAAHRTFANATVHALSFGEKAILAKLRTMSDAEFESLPFGSEGLWRKLMHVAREEAGLEDIIAATKSKRYTRTRIDRMILCAFLGIKEEMLHCPAPYVRVLALNDKGREILKKARQFGQFPNIGEKQDHPYQALEDQCDQLYGLFSQHPEAARAYRVYYAK